MNTRFNNINKIREISDFVISTTKILKFTIMQCQKTGQSKISTTHFKQNFSWLEKDLHSFQPQFQIQCLNPSCCIPTKWLSRLSSTVMSTSSPSIVVRRFLFRSTQSASITSLHRYSPSSWDSLAHLSVADFGYYLFKLLPQLKLGERIDPKALFYSSNNLCKAFSEQAFSKCWLLFLLSSESYWTHCIFPLL